MLILLRIIITGALIYVFGLMSEAGTSTHYSGDLTQAFYMAIVLVLAILMAAVWAPYLGERIATPLTGELTCGSFGDQRRWLPSMIRWFDHQGWRHATLWCCILEGLDHPDFPMPFTTGLRHTRSGSWWEKVFAREVFRFDNAQNCLEAAAILKARHGIELTEHPRPSITIALRQRDRKTVPDRPPTPLPKAPPPKKPRRNQRIRLFLDPSASTQKGSDRDYRNQNQENLESEKPL